MTFVSSTEVLVNQNNCMHLVNLYLAESATEEARDRIRSLIASSQLSLSDPSKVVYIVADSSINPTTGNADSNPYFDRSGNETASLPDIATIELGVTMRTRQVDPLTKIRRTLSESTRIHPQNL